MIIFNFVLHFGFVDYFWRGRHLKHASASNEFKLFFLVFNCQRSINNISFLYLVNSSNDKSTRIFADATCLAGSLPIRWASCLLHASRTVNFPYREETGCEGASHMMASLEWHIKRLLTWHLKRQMLQDHFTLNMCSVLALHRDRIFSLLSQPGIESWLYQLLQRGQLLRWLLLRLRYRKHRS